VTKASSATAAKATSIRGSERVGRRHGELERLLQQAPPADLRSGRAEGGQLEVDVAPSLQGRRQLVALGSQVEADPGVVRAEPAHEVRDQPGPERGLEGQRHGPRLEVDQLVDGGQPVVQLMEHRVDVALERHAGVRETQPAAGPSQQGRSDLALEPGRRPRHAGLRRVLAG